jgi:hypothetical protein
MSDDAGDVAGLTGRPPRVIPEPKPKSVHGPAKVVAMCNQKGGVGKTTSTINLGASLAEYGRRVLLVDLDPQGALSAGLGVPHYELDHTVHNLLVDPKVSIDEVLIKTRVKGLDLVPSNIDLSAAEIQLVNEVGREQSLARALHPVLDRYDYVLIDCQPSLGLLTVNGLACADGVRVLLAARAGPADRHRRQGARPAQSPAGHQRHPDHALRHPHGQRPRGDGPSARAVRRSGLRHRDRADGPLSRDQRRRRADHHVGTEIWWRPGVSDARP